MFNKSHSFAYAVLTLQTAYLKAHYPLEYMTALLCSVLGDYATISKYINDAKHLGLKVLPPSILKSQRNFSIYRNSILFGLQAIKNVGEKAVDTVLEKRNDSMKSFKQFLNVFYKELDKKTIISLVKAGCFGINKKRFFLEKFSEYDINNKIIVKEYEPKKTFCGYTLKKLKEEFDIEEKDKNKRLELFNIAKEKEFYIKQEKNNKRLLEEGIENFKIKYLQKEEMWEFETLSMFITHDPFEKYNKKVRPISKIKDGQEGIVLGVITNVTKKTNKNKKRFAFIEMYNEGNILELSCWSTQFEEYEDLLKKESTLVIKVKKKNNALSIVNIKPFDIWKEEKIN